MGTKIFCFSSTGNSLYVAKRIANGLDDCEIISIPKAIKDQRFKFHSRNIGFVFPLHCFGLPIAVREFVSKMEIGENPYIFAIQVTGGGSSKNSFEDLNKLLGKSKVSINTIGEIKYISNYIRAGRNATENRVKRSIDKNEPIINELIKLIQEKRDDSDKIKGSVIHKLLYKLWKDKYKNKDSAFNVNSHCIVCNVCEKICPVDNIEIVDKKVKWKGKCIDCMACINNCPKNAINIGKKTQKKNRYRNPKVKLEELL